MSHTSGSQCHSDTHVFSPDNHRDNLLFFPVLVNRIPIVDLTLGPLCRMRALQLVTHHVTFPRLDSKLLSQMTFCDTAGGFGGTGFGLTARQAQSPQASS